MIVKASDIAANLILALLTTIGFTAIGLATSSHGASMSWCYFVLSWLTLFTVITVADIYLSLKGRL